MDQFDPNQESSEFFDKLEEELGDVLLQILLHAQLASEKSKFSFESICKRLNEKLIHRHPHVFGTEKKLDTAEQVLNQWSEIKAKDRPKEESVLASIPKALPALQRAAKVIDRVTEIGFQWPDLNGPLEKLNEEVGELRQAISTEKVSDIREELGDVIFCLCNIAHFFKIPPEESLREFLVKFERRFNHVESKITGLSKPIPLTTLDRFWDEAKAMEKSS